jgi:arsenite transporter
VELPDPGDAAYTLVQVALNDVIMLFAFAPIVLLLLGLGDITVPYDTVFLSVVLYIVIPWRRGWSVRQWACARRGRSGSRRSSWPGSPPFPWWGSS